MSKRIKGKTLIAKDEGDEETRRTYGAKKG